MDQSRILTEEQQAQLTQRLMRRQASLSIGIAAIFVVLLVALPLANLYAPKLMNSEVFGFTLTWFLLAIVFFPLTCILSIYFVKKTDQIEGAASMSASDEASRP